MHGQTFTLGKLSFEVRLAPGHTPGHVMFYCAEAGVLFCGDVIFQGSIGRTDLPGGSYPQLIRKHHHPGAHPARRDPFAQRPWA